MHIWKRIFVPPAAPFWSSASDIRYICPFVKKSISTWLCSCSHPSLLLSIMVQHVGQASSRHTADDLLAPLSINCWPRVFGRGSFFGIKYKSTIPVSFPSCLFFFACLVQKPSGSLAPLSIKPLPLLLLAERQRRREPLRSACCKFSWPSVSGGESYFV